MYTVSPTPRLRASPFFDSTVAAGATDFTSYNRMLMPTGYGDPEAEYWQLLNGVSMWDVAAQRQVQLQGPDAAKLAQILCTRDLADCNIGLGKYVALCNHEGTLINDPILLKLSDDLFWLSISDSNIHFWSKAIAGERNMNVEISEPDVSPLAVQGPKAIRVVESIFGSWLPDLKYFGFRETELNGIPVVVARSGYSKQGGYEIYLRDGSKGAELWNLVREAGQPWDIRPGYPNQSERIESGLLSYGADTDHQTNPYELRLGKYVDLHLPDQVIGISALKQIHAEGIRRRQLGIVFAGDRLNGLNRHWLDILHHGEKVGEVTSSVWSWRLEQNVGLSLVSTKINPGDDVQITVGNNLLDAQLSELPFF